MFKFHSGKKYLKNFKEVIQAPFSENKITKFYDNLFFFFILLENHIFNSIDKEHRMESIKNVEIFKSLKLFYVL